MCTFGNSPAYTECHSPPLSLPLLVLGWGCRGSVVDGNDYLHAVSLVSVNTAAWGLQQTEGKRLNDAKQATLSFREMEVNDHLHVLLLSEQRFPF